MSPVFPRLGDCWASRIKSARKRLENICALVALQACVLLPKLNNFWKTLESRATGIYTKVSPRKEIWESICPARWVLETGVTASPAAQPSNTPAAPTLYPWLFSPAFIRANNSTADSAAVWNIHSRDKGDVAESLCIPFCMPFAPVGRSEPVRCSGLVVCALLRRKQNQWIRTNSGARGRNS